MIYLFVRLTAAEAAKNRTIPPSKKTVNSQTIKNSTKHTNNLKFNRFYFRYYFRTFKTPSIQTQTTQNYPILTTTNRNSTLNTHSIKGRLKSFSDDLCIFLLPNSISRFRYFSRQTVFSYVRGVLVLLRKVWQSGGQGGV